MWHRFYLRSQYIKSQNQMFYSCYKVYKDFSKKKTLQKCFFRANFPWFCKWSIWCGLYNCFQRFGEKFKKIKMEPEYIYHTIVKKNHKKNVTKKMYQNAPKSVWFYCYFSKIKWINKNRIVNFWSHKRQNREKEYMYIIINLYYYN